MNLRIGARAHDFGKLPADELASRLAIKGLCCAQLAVSKAIEGIDLKPGEMNPGLCWTVGQAFAKHGVQIAVLGCYINPIHPDVQMRRQLLGVFKEHIRHARDFGCSIVGLETGSVNADYSPHPDNQSERAFDHFLTSIAALVQEAEKFGVTVCIEAVTSHVVSTPAKMRQVLNTIKSNNLQVIFDPVNLIDASNYRNQLHIMDESFELFGDRISIIHAKDFTIDENGKYKQVSTGQGILDYPHLMKWITARKPGISILLEDASEASAEECIRYIEASLK